MYLNEIYLGQGTYGVASASLEYFNKSVKELNYNEAALLAVLPKAQVNIPLQIKIISKNQKKFSFKQFDGEWLHI